MHSASTVGRLTAQVQKYLIDFTERNSFLKVQNAILAVDQIAVVCATAERRHSKRGVAGCKNPASSS
ncbi:hypothetical protein LJR258_005839 [Rhizobium sp. LjRoot258]